MAANANSNVSIIFKLLGWRSVVEGSEQSAKAVGKVGLATKTAGKHAKESEGHFGGLLKSLAAFGIGYEALTGLRESVTATKELGEASLNLNKIQGLSIGQANEFAMIAQVRGIGQTKLAQGLNILSRNSINAVKQWNATDRSQVASSRAAAEQLAAIRMSYDQRIAKLGTSASAQVQRQVLLQERSAALAKAEGDIHFKAGQKTAKGLGTAADAFKALGFTQAEVLAGQKDLGAFINTIAERFNEMPGGAKKAQVGLQLFGRGAQSFLPLFKEGNESLAQQEAWARQFGVSMPRNAKQLREYLVQSDRAKFATLGLQEEIGTKLLPALTSLISAWPRLVTNIREGNGAWGTVRTLIHGVVDPLTTVVGLFGRSKKATEGLVWALGFLGAAFAIEKVVKFYKALRALWVIEKTLAAGTLVFAGAQRALATSMVASEVAGVPMLATFAKLSTLLKFGGPLAAFLAGSGLVGGPFSASAGWNTTTEDQHLKALKAKGMAPTKSQNDAYLKRHGGNAALEEWVRENPGKPIPNRDLRPLLRHPLLKIPKVTHAAMTAPDASALMGGDLVVHTHLHVGSREVAESTDRHRLKTLRRVPTG